MFGTTVFGLDTGAWLAEHHRATVTLIDSASRAVAAVPERTENAALIGCGELACC